MHIILHSCTTCAPCWCFLLQSLRTAGPGLHQPMSNSSAAMQLCARDADPDDILWVGMGISVKLRGCGMCRGKASLMWLGPMLVLSAQLMARCSRLSLCRSSTMQSFQVMLTHQTYTSAHIGCTHGLCVLTLCRRQGVDWTPACHADES